MRMKALRIEKYGALDNLVVQDVPTPVPGEGEVLIDVRAVAVNFSDILMVNGTYQVKPDLPFSPGLEVGGLVSAIGEGVEGLHPGDRIQALTHWGGYAEKVIAAPEFCTPIPAAMSFEEAAALVIVYSTAHVALTIRAQVTPGDWLIVTGAGGGVGLAAVEIGTILGARVIAIASSKEKLKAAGDKGAEVLLLDSFPELAIQIKEISGGQGAKLLFDPVGGELFENISRALAPEAKAILVGFASGKLQTLRANHLLVKNIDVVGFNWGLYKRYKSEIMHNSIHQLLTWFEAGMIRPYIGKTFPLSEGRDAVQYLLDRKAIGKVIITVS
jgi:NADPH2:quinone reductase